GGGGGTAAGRGGGGDVGSARRARRASPIPTPAPSMPRPLASGFLSASTADTARLRRQSALAEVVDHEIDVTQRIMLRRDRSVVAHDVCRHATLPVHVRCHTRFCSFGVGGHRPGGAFGNGTGVFRRETVANDR